MGRELYFGPTSVGLDARIARPGFDALLDDVNDRTKMAFAASWQSIGRIAEIGTVSSIGAWIPFLQSYSSPPNIELALRRSNYVIRGYTEITTTFDGIGGVYNVGGTLYVAHVEATQFRVLRPTRYASTGAPGDQIQYFVVQ
ncbi:hypothetical protein [Enterovirga rhinocerotis]|uniref:Uncharacterized protein n=1 Tax=Enterovirga rhinocerotis TaxID=1339210 RepID=A0A4R7BXP9_9HYPH|nr:hypothetical protein [Enterovirga rhinocerotis]TDR90283.1 hypothetical protein EV668_3129 [Enterovirga rhinocerotis]